MFGKSLVLLTSIGMAGCAASPAMLPAPVPASQLVAECAGKSGWSDPAPQTRIFANVYTVGTCGIVVLLITSDQGHILIDGATEEAAPSIAANIERLGFKLGDVKIILTSHEHLDHVGGLAALQRMTGAAVMARAPAVQVLESGAMLASDPQVDTFPDFPSLSTVKTIEDGDPIFLGDIELTTHATPGHSPGSTSWTWKSCEGEICRSMVYADSVSAVSGDAYRFSDHPQYVADFRKTLDKLALLHCDLLITPHPSASNLFARMSGTAPLLDPEACRNYAAIARGRLDQRLARENAESQQ